MPVVTSSNDRLTLETEPRLSTDGVIPGIHSQRWSHCLREHSAAQPGRNATLLIGVLRGEGIGPEIVDCTLSVLRAAARKTGVQIQLEFGGDIGRLSEAHCGQALSEEVAG